MIMQPEEFLGKKPNVRAVTIMPAAVQNQITFTSVSRAMTSHGNRSRLVVMINHTPRKWLEKVARVAMEGRHSVLVVPPNHPLNLNLYYTMGALLTESSDSEYVIYANSDVVFHGNWDTHMLDQWDNHPDKDNILSVHAYSQTSHGTGPSYRDEPGSGILESVAPLMQAWAIRRDTKWKFDTRFDFFNTDCDFWLSADKIGKKMMVSQEARVDHVNSVSRNYLENVPKVKSVQESNELMKQKWGGMYHG